MLNALSIMYLGIGLAFLISLIFWTLLQKLSLVNLRTISVVLIWVQYHLSPWLYLITGDWNDWILVPELLSTALGYSTLAMIALSIGYGKPTNKQKYDIKKFIDQYNVNKSTSYAVISVCTALSLIVFTISVGSDELIESAFDRGAYQWMERDLIGQVILQFRTLSIVLGTISVGMACYTLVIHRHTPIIFEIMIIFINFVCSVSLIWKFSRVSGALFIVSAILIVVLSKMNVSNKRRPYKNNVFVALLMALGVYMSFIGITHRDVYPSGVQPYLVAVASPTVSELHLGRGGAMDVGFSATSNFLDSSSAFSRSLAGNRNLDFSILEAAVKFVGILQPLPSGLLGIDGTVGRSVTDILGTRGKVGLTTPTLAELFLLFGWPGAIVMLGFGRLLKYSDQQAAEGRLIGVFGLAVLSGAIVVSGHSGLRAMARLAVTMLILFAVFPGKSRSSLARAARRQRLRRLPVRKLPGHR